MRLPSPRVAFVLAATLTMSITVPAGAQSPHLLSDEEISALAAELSGELAKRTLEAIAREHRTRGSRPLRAASDLIADRARAYGLEQVRVDEFPADGDRFYGTQRSRKPWDAEFAELWEVRVEGTRTTPVTRLASWDAEPMSLAQDSESGEVTADLVDVGAGTAEADYAGRDVRGKLVLVSAQPGAAAGLAVGRHGAAGLVSFALNQPTAWRGDDDTVVRWGHLETFGPVKTFAFMVSPRTARGLRERLARGERVTLHARVKAGQREGGYSIATAAIAGADPALRDEEIVFSCHLDHPRPGANDNASGCVAILEAGRALARLIADGRLPRPARTLRFVWPPEIEGTIVLLAGRPDWAARVRAAIHLDMVGGGPETKAVFHVTRGPRSLPSFVHDVADAFGRLVNDQSLAFASTGRARWPLVAREGGREPLLGQLSAFTSGSDHQVYAEGSWRIPAIYLNDWPDRYIHTTRDTAAMIDPTKLLRASFIAAASGYYLATMERRPAGTLADTLVVAGVRRAADALARRAELPTEEGAVVLRDALRYERGVLRSVEAFGARDAGQQARFDAHLRHLEGLLQAPPAPPARGEGALVFSRAAAPRGPMAGFGYDYFLDKYGEDRARALALLSHEGASGGGDDYAYEVLNLVDGRRSAQEIRDIASAAFGPVPIEAVVQYLRALASIGIVSAP